MGFPLYRLAPEQFAALMQYVRSYSHLLAARFAAELELELLLVEAQELVAVVQVAEPGQQLVAQRPEPQRL